MKRGGGGVKKESSTDNVFITVTDDDEAGLSEYFRGLKLILSITADFCGFQKPPLAINIRGVEQ